jgi:hypothetical protein
MISKTTSDRASTGHEVIAREAKLLEFSDSSGHGQEGWELQWKALAQVISDSLKGTTPTKFVTM